MAIPAELESISSQDGDGSVAHGIHREVITFSGAGVGTSNYQLLPEESGALVIFNSLTGNLVTLPTPAKGIWFEFINQIARTSGETKIVTKDITTDFILGSIISASETVAEGMDVFTADGTSNHVSISMNGTTTGGEVGTRIVLTALNSTQWLVKGTNQGSGGAVVDPFSSS